MAEVLAIADDLTGALEVGALFAESGVANVVTTRSTLDRDPSTADFPVCVVDLESRHLAAEDAAKKVGDVATELRQAGGRGLYKKTDSTLRGPIGAELNAIMEAWPDRSLVFVPAYPRLGRVVRGGRLFIDGRPLEKTDFSHDPLQPVHSGWLREILEPSVDARVVLVENSDALSLRLEQAEKPALYVCDGETEDDLDAVAQCVMSRKVWPLMAGPAGFVRPLSELLSLPHGERPRRSAASTGLVVNGSLHAASRKQIQRAQSSGLPLVVLSADQVSDADALRELIALSREHRWVLFETEPLKGSRAPDSTVSRTIAQRLAKVVSSFLAAHRTEALVVFGGDTAHAIVSALEVSDLRPLGELQVGVPVCHLQQGEIDLTLATKAGGFGGPDTVSDICTALRRAGGSES